MFCVSRVLIDPDLAAEKQIFRCCSADCRDRDMAAQISWKLGNEIALFEAKLFASADLYTAQKLAAGRIEDCSTCSTLDSTPKRKRKSYQAYDKVLYIVV